MQHRIICMIKDTDMRKHYWMLRSFFIFLFFVPGLICCAATRTWDKGGDQTNWFNAANWSDNQLPGNGDSAVINNSASVLLTNATAELSSFTITNATLTFTNWNTAIRATDVFIQHSGILSHTQCNTNPVESNTNRVYILCSNLTVTAGGSINVNTKGFIGADGLKNGQGPGGARRVSAYSAGGGYGSRGGDANADDGGQIYGSPATPSEPGSGGTDGQSASSGGKGGGAVWIEADGRVRVDGTISANGQNGVDQFSGGGSGGGIYISCNTFESTGGTITADGGGKGSDTRNGGGGGGRIAIHYNAAAQADVTPKPSFELSASGRQDRYTGLTDPGSLYLTDSTLLPESCGPESFHDISLFDFSSWSPESLTISNAWLMFSASNFVLTVTNDMCINGDSGRIDMLNGSPAIDVGGNLIMEGGAKLHVYSGVTNNAPTNYGCLVTVSGDITVGASCWIYPHSHPTDGGSPLFRMRNLTISTNAGFNANGLGFPALSGSGDGQGYGGPHRVNAYSAGAGHGGRGGDGGSADSGGAIYGSSNAPVHAGSSGVNGQGTAYGNGGGVVRMEVSRKAQVDGTITANGDAASAQFGGGGSGGSIFIDCNTLRGGTNGVIRANGGNKGSDYHNGSGAGGRIAIWCCTEDYQGSTSVTGGLADASYPARWGETGTVVWIFKPFSGTVVFFR